MLYTERVKLPHFVELAFAPSITFGILLAIVWRYVATGRLRIILQWVSALLFFVPQPFALYLGAYTSRLRFYQQVLLSLWGFGTGVLMTMQLFSRSRQTQSGTGGALWRAAMWRQSGEEIQKTQLLLKSLRSTQRKPPNKFVLMLGIIAMLGLGVYCGWNVVGDYLLKHETVSGTVQGARVIGGTRSPDRYQLIIDHKAYGITRDLLAQMNRGDHIEVEVGIASRTILEIRHRSH